MSLSNDMTVLACSRLLVRFTRLLKNEVGATPDVATCALSKTTGATAIKSGADPVQVCASDSEQRPRGGTPEREPVQRRVRWATPMADAGEGVLGWLCRGLLWERNACRAQTLEKTYLPSTFFSHPTTLTISGILEDNAATGRNRPSQLSPPREKQPEQQPVGVMMALWKM